jgi:protein-tyrosine phosphatase
MNILFICSRNQCRSRTAEVIFADSEEHVVRSAGTAASARIKVNEAMLLWADLVFCMENEHRDILNQRFPTATRDLRLIVLDIEDEYKFMDTELIEELEIATAPYF